MRVTGRQWAAFLEFLPEHFYFDGDETPEGGEVNLNEVIEISSGTTIRWQNTSEEIEIKPDEDFVLKGVFSESDINFLRHFGRSMKLPTVLKRFLAVQSKVVMFFEIDREKQKEAEAYLVSMGAVVTKF